MKARVKSTGEIIEVAEFDKSNHFFIDTKGAVYGEEELVVQSEEHIDWEQRRYEIAKDILSATYSNPNQNISREERVIQSINIADALIAELKTK